ncbi:MAG: hypothetical protein HUJ25_07565 [Crocinitomicaceae bacterium]|nr:hypothetical protein [Crocinitomicaceae bacterium]
MSEKQISVLILHWIKANGELHYILRDIQIKLLFDRLVLRMTFDELAKTFRSTPGKIRQIFEALLIRIEKYMSCELAKLLRNYSNHLDNMPNVQPHDFEFSRIFLN